MLVRTQKSFVKIDNRGNLVIVSAFLAIRKEDASVLTAAACYIESGS